MVPLRLPNGEVLRAPEVHHSPRTNSVARLISSNMFTFTRSPTRTVAISQPARINNPTASLSWYSPSADGRSSAHAWNTSSSNTQHPVVTSVDDGLTGFSTSPVTPPPRPSRSRRASARLGARPAQPRARRPPPRMRRPRARRSPGRRCRRSKEERPRRRTAPPVTPRARAPAARAGGHT